MNPEASFAAVDLGATSGRVMLTHVTAAQMTLVEAARFTNDPVTISGHLHWNVDVLYEQVLDGLRAATTLRPEIASVGIDGWAVDFGLLDSRGSLLGAPFHYRDARTERVAPAVRDAAGAAQLYRRNGLQYLPFNTIFQLAATDPQLRCRARTLLLIPDLMAYRLTGIAGTEVTNASTTGLLDVHTRQWDSDLLGCAGVNVDLLAPLRAPGTVLGPVRPEAAARSGLTRASVVTVATHDTASAVLATPASGTPFAYISCGTWSLVGLELTAPVLTDAAREANFTNEAGVDGTVRFLRNVMGLWLLEESLRAWRHEDTAPELSSLLAAAQREPARRAVIDPDDARFLDPSDMPAEIRAFCRESGQPVPQTPAGVTRTIMDSLALAHRRALNTACALADFDAQVVHLVGGGSRNALLAQLAADACARPVLAGPAEASSIGNALMQARAHGLVSDLPELRAVVRRSFVTRRYEPRGTDADWDALARRIAVA